MPELNESEVAASAGMREAAAVIAVSAAGASAPATGITVHMGDRTGFVGEVLLGYRDTDTVIDDVPVCLLRDAGRFVFALHEEDGDGTDSCADRTRKRKCSKPALSALCR